MKRRDIVKLIGEEFSVENIENSEFSYQKALREQGKNFLDFLPSKSNFGIKDINHKNLDLRFVKDKLSVLVETKKNIRVNPNQFMWQLHSYACLEKELTGNFVVAILHSIDDDTTWVWQDGSLEIADFNRDKKERSIQTIDYYYDLQFGVKNDRNKVLQNTYRLNELLHQHGINEKIRSQFVGTCLLALKQGFNYGHGVTSSMIRAAISDKLTLLLDQDFNKAEKLVILKTRVIDSQDVRGLSDDDFKLLLNYIEENILPYINDKNTAGQDLLNLFFTTFNKYVGKSDKNQAFTPDHIVHFMCKIAEVNKNSKVFDPCCGSGAFLVRALTEMLDDCDTLQEQDKVKKEQIYGIEFEDGAYGLATTNMLIHGDGNSNIYQGSCFDETILNQIDNGVDIVLMNPPYNAQKKHCSPSYVRTWRSSQKEDPSKGFDFVYKTAEKIQKGKLLVLLPVQCAIGSSNEISSFKSKMLEKHTLEAVFSLPDDMFHPGANASACCMVFKLGVRHESISNNGTFFGFFKNDGFIKKKNLGRVERESGLWNKIENEWLNLYFSKQNKAGLSIVRKVTADDEWLAEAYMETDYSILNQSMFEKSVREYASFLVKTGSAKIHNKRNKNNTPALNSQSWISFFVKDLFEIEGTLGETTDQLDYGYEIPYIAAKKESNGLDEMCSLSAQNQKYISKGNCIVFIQLGQGSAGYALYQGSDFIGMNGKTSCGRNSNLDSLTGIFLVTILDMERPKYSYGRSWTGDRLNNTKIKLPAVKNENGEYEPDWSFMREYIKTLPYSELI